MGNQQDALPRFNYVEVAAEAVDGYSAVYRAKDFKEKLLVAPKNGIRTLQRMFQVNFNQLSSREFLGFKPILRWRLDPDSGVRNPEHEAEFSFFSYRGVEQKVRHLNAALQSKGLVSLEERLGNRCLRLLGIHAQSNIEQFMVEIACICFGLTTVQLGALFTEAEVERVFEQTQLQTIFVGLEQVGLYLELLRQGRLRSLKHIVVFNADALFPAERAALDSLKQVSWHCYEALLELGAKLPQTNFPPVQPDDILSLCFTSGSTGEPKAVPISHRNAVGFLAAVDSRAIFLHSRTVYFSYLPLCQILEKMMFFAVSYKGGKYAVTCSGNLALLDEIKAVQPTILVGSPQIFKQFAFQIQQHIDRLPGLVSWYLNRAVHQKCKQLRSGSYEHSLLEDKMFASSKQLFGGRLEVLCSGSAIMDQSTKQFLMSVLGCPFVEGYGTTETIGAAFFTNPLLLSDLDNQGGPLPSLEFKFQAEPQLGLLSDAKDAFGRPIPGGEILLRGASVFEGYYKNEALTRAALDEDGWFHTADLGVLCPKTRALKLLGNKHEAFKLQPGDFIFPQVLESIYQSSPLINNIFVHGSPLQPCIIAVVHLQQARAETLARDLKIDFVNYPSLLASPQFKQAVLDHLNRIAVDHKLKAYECVRAIHLEIQGFGTLGLQTATLKLIRRKCRANYEEIIGRLYAELQV